MKKSLQLQRFLLDDVKVVSKASEWRVVGDWLEIWKSPLKSDMLVSTTTLKESPRPLKDNFDTSSDSSLHLVSTLLANTANF